MLDISTKSNNYLKMNVYANNAESEGDLNLKKQSLNQNNNPFGEAVSLELSNEYLLEKSTYEGMLRESKVQRTLKQGSKGNDVKTLQGNLNYLGYNVGTADGVFGAKTKSAVIAYQRAHGLEVDGIAGPATQNSIARAVAAKQAAEAAAEAARKAGILQQGSKGEAVVKLQKNLVALGYNPKGTDGIFGADTKAAVMLFQEVCGLTADGVAGKNTNDAINRALNNKNAGALSRGLISGEVTSLQNNLKILGFYSGSSDGIYGAGTESAVRNFQRAHGLSQDGVAGAGTKQTIATALAAKAAAEAAEKAARENGVLQRGSKGDAVVRLQKNLNALGYDTKGTDGIYGNDTRTAVMKFQEVYGLEVDGVAGKETLNAINSAAALRHAGNISRGMVLSEVRELQSGMMQLGYYSGKLDGVFGAGTEAAVIKFQKVNGQNADGVVRQATKMAIDAALEVVNNSSNEIEIYNKNKIPKFYGNTIVPPKTGDKIYISYGIDKTIEKAEVASTDAWAIEYDVSTCFGTFKNDLCAERLNTAINNFSYNKNEENLICFNVPGFGNCYAGAMVDGFGRVGDVAEVELDDGYKFSFLILDVKHTNHDSSVMDETETSKQCQTKWGHGSVFKKTGRVQLNICEFIASVKKEGDGRDSAKNYDNGSFLIDRRVAQARVIGHVDAIK